MTKHSIMRFLSPVSIAALLRSAMLPLALVLAMLTAAASAPAFAQSAAAPIDTSDINLTPGDCDLSMYLLDSVLKGSGQGMGSDEAHCRSSTYAWLADSQVGPVGKLFLYFNTLVLIFGAALLVYVVVMGTMRSAEDGEVLGKGWSVVWVPARVSVGFLALFPTSSGFSWVQIAVIWLASQGVGAGNYLWERTVSSVLNSQGDMAAVALGERSQTLSVMNELLRSEICVRNSNLVVADNMHRGPYGFDQNFYNETSAGKLGGAVMRWGNLSERQSISVCGNIVSTSASVWDGYGGEGASAIKDALWGGSGERNARALVQRAQADALFIAKRQLEPLAERLVMSDSTNRVSDQDIFATLIDAAEQYQRRLAGGLNRPLSEAMNKMTSSFRESAASDGWITAGAFYYQLARISSQINDIASYVPKSQSTASVDTSSDGTTTIGIGVPHLISERLDRVLRTQIAAGNPKWESYQGGLERSHFDHASNWVTNNATRMAYHTFSVNPNSTNHAIVQLKNVGDNILNVVETVAIGSAAVTLANRFPASIGARALNKFRQVIPTGSGSGPLARLGNLFSGEGFSWMVMLGALLLFSLLVGAIVLAFWIPVAPFVIWVVGVFGWVVSIMEMLIAAPLWAAAHLHPEGEGMAGKHGANGYMIVLEVVLRPMLMIAGLILAFVLVDPFLRFLSLGFFKAMTFANGDSVSGLVTFAAFLAIYIGLCMSLVHRSFALIHMVPNSVLRWIGAHSNSYDNGDAANHVQNVVVGYLQRTGGAVRHHAPAGLGAMGNAVTGFIASDKGKKGGGKRSSD